MSRPYRPSRRPFWLELEAFEPRTLLAVSPLRIGSLGDSLTDEYQFYGPDRTAARNWVQVLSSLRSAEVSFGEFTTSDRGETRNQGYAQNWARSGAQATPGEPDVSGANTFFVQQYQGGFTPGAPGLITQQGGLSNVDAVTILIGGNDFRNALETALIEPQSTNVGANILENLLKTRAGIAAGVEGAVSALQAAAPGLPIVLAVTPNITDTALFDELTSLLPPGDVKLLDGLIDSLINELKTNFQSLVGPTVALVDPNAIFTRFTQQADTIEGLFINPEDGGPNTTDLFVGDLFHPGVVAQSLLANGFLSALDTLFPDRELTPLTDAEIVAFARLVQPVTQASLTAGAPVVAPGELATFNVQVNTFATPIGTPGPGPFPAPTGTVAFLDAANGNALLATATLDLQGRASFSTSSLSTGLHQVVASYSGDTVYPPTATPAASIVVGTTSQAQLIGLIQIYQQRLGQQVAPPLLNRWTRWLNHGVRPEAIARTIIKRVAHTPLPRPSRPAVPAAPARPFTQGSRPRLATLRWGARAPARVS